MRDGEEAAATNNRHHSQGITSSRLQLLRVRSSTYLAGVTVTVQ